MGRKGKKLLASVGAILSLALIAGVIIGVMTNDDKKAKASNTTATNGVIMQGFEWYLKNTGTHWNDLADKASELADAGITAMWLPPAYKADDNSDVGYGVYDIYDLGEFNQNGSVRTKYGTKAEYFNLIDTLHSKGIQVYADVVLNHMAGAEGTQTVSAYECNSGSRSSTISGAHDIAAWCVFNFPGRNGKYSTFKWDASCFDGVDWDQNTSKTGVYRFANKEWDWQVDTEYGNYDYLMYADVDFDNQNVVNELKNWGKWYVDTADLDGFRLDAVKHIKYSFYSDWLTTVREKTNKELFSVGEFWSGDNGKLNEYIKATNNTTSLFDVPLHYNMYAASNGSGNYDMSKLFDSTLVSSNPTKAVTFVDNHDSQPGQSLQSTVMSWFKPLAYTAILTREGGYPCVFYGDYYGTVDGGISSNKSAIDKILLARKDYAYGTQHEYLNDANVIGWTREGDSSHENSGLAALITDGAGGSKSMYVGTSHSGETWYDITGNISSTVTVGSNGYGTFSVKGGSHSIWVPKTSNGEEIVTEDGKVTIYYYNANSWNDVYAHYGINNSWTTVPGVKMNTTSDSKYFYCTIDMGTASSVTVCFNNGSNSWDSNNGSNYTVKAGSYTIKNGSVSSGVPANVMIASETAAPTVTPTIAPTVKPTQAPTVAPTVAPTEAPTVAPTVAPTATPAASSNKVVVYYYNSSGWNNVYIHYCVNGGSWTSVPGVQMTKYSGNYYYYTIDLGTASKATVCFNNGSGSWDSKNGSNYTVYTGEYKIKDGSTVTGNP